MSIISYLFSKSNNYLSFFDKKILKVDLMRVNTCVFVKNTEKNTCVFVQIEEKNTCVFVKALISSL